MIASWACTKCGRVGSIEVGAGVDVSRDIQWDHDNDSPRCCYLVVDSFLGGMILGTMGSQSWDRLMKRWERERNEAQIRREFAERASWGSDQA